jgi:hypothetical protein
MPAALKASIDGPRLFVDLGGAARAAESVAPSFWIDAAVKWSQVSDPRSGGQMINAPFIETEGQFL